MQELLATLLGMENEARQAAHVADDNEFYTQTEIERRIAQIEREAKIRIANIEREFINDTQAQTQKIEQEYVQKTESMEAFFAHEHENLVEKIVHEVLHGY